MVVTPAPFLAPGWNQEEYLAFLGDAIRPAFRALYFSDDWSGATVHLRVRRGAGTQASYLYPGRAGSGAGPRSISSFAPPRRSMPRASDSSGLRENLERPQPSDDSLSRRLSAGRQVSFSADAISSPCAATAQPSSTSSRLRPPPVPLALLIAQGARAGRSDWLLERLDSLLRRRARSALLAKPVRILVPSRSLRLHLSAAIVRRRGKSAAG